MVKKWIKKIFWKAGENLFFSNLLAILISLLIGVVLFYVYIFIPLNKTPDLEEHSFLDQLNYEEFLELKRAYDQNLTEVNFDWDKVN